MGTGPVFISHASDDDEFVRDLRVALEGQGIAVWVDSRNLRGGDKLKPEIDQAIEEARQVIVVLSPQTQNSSWVRDEIRKAQEVEQQSNDDDYRVIPLLLTGVEPSALKLWFDEEPLAVPVTLETGGVSEALQPILSALGEELPNDGTLPPSTPTQPLEELILKLEDPLIETTETTRRAKATATITYRPANPAARDVSSRRFSFTAPLGPIEIDELRWYLESYYLWPTGVFKERAERVERTLPEWGKLLYDATLGKEEAQQALHGWHMAESQADRRFSVLVDEHLVQSDDADTALAQQAAVELLALPWELLHAPQGYLFEGAKATRVRRRLPNHYPQAARVTELPIRILLVSPRPEDEYTGYIDHRVSALPLVQAVEKLGDLVELTVLTPPTFGALGEALEQADKSGKPFDVVHFDGHGVYDPRRGLGQLCFEDPESVTKLQKRKVELIDAEQMASVMRDSRIPLVFLEACQSAHAKDDPRASVAAKLLEHGVTSVVAMSHSVLVETARRFVEVFYRELAQGARVGQAMLAGQRALKRDTKRGTIMGAGELRLQDWFVPVLYQEEQDPQLFETHLSQEAERLAKRAEVRSVGRLPEPPPHTFVGRSRALLALERLLFEEKYALIVGSGGMGKTAIAVELARWLVRTDRFQRAAFVSLETYTDDRGVVDSLGKQLLPEGEKWSVAEFNNLTKALQPIERALRDHPIIIVLDNLESVLPDTTGAQPLGATPIDELLSLFQGLLDASSTTRLVFTSREGLPAPFNHSRCGVRLGTLSHTDAINLVGHVLGQRGEAPPQDDAGNTQQEIQDLVESVNCHPRALVLLAHEVSQRGVQGTTQELRQLMQDLDTKHPNDRENSLYASVELSLRRLSEEARERIKPLAVFHGGVNLAVWKLMLEVELETIARTAQELIGVGLAEAERGSHLRLDPALPAYVRGEFEESELEHWRERWGEGMQALRRFLTEQLDQNIDLASSLTILELPNLLAWLEWIQVHKTHEEVVLQTTLVERLLEFLGRRRAMNQVMKIRKEATQELQEWNHAQFRTKSASAQRSFEDGHLQDALTELERLLQNCLDAGEAAYENAPYDIAYVYWQIGSMTKHTGSAQRSLEYFDKGLERFKLLAESGNDSAKHMANTVASERADVLMELGRWDEAATIYEEVIRLDEDYGRQREIAASKGQLGTARMHQGRYAEALALHAEVREMFETWNEPGTVAGSWYLSGMVHRLAQQYEEAEEALKKSLSMWVQQQNPSGEGMTLGELGTLFNDMAHWEEAEACWRQAVDTCNTVSNRFLEGMSRVGLAKSLIKLGRCNDARLELNRGIKCIESYSHAAKLWAAWDTLHDLELADGNPQVATQAREKAIQSYLAYRRDDGGNQTKDARLYTLVEQAIHQEEATEVIQQLAQLAERENVASRYKILIPKLQAVLRGDRDPALAADPALRFDDTVELQLLLEQLS